MNEKFAHHKISAFVVLCNSYLTHTNPHIFVKYVGQIILLHLKGKSYIDILQRTLTAIIFYASES